jgi:predicted RNase H-like nuclease
MPVGLHRSARERGRGVLIRGVLGARSPPSSSRPARVQVQVQVQVPVPVQVLLRYSAPFPSILL